MASALLVTYERHHNQHVLSRSSAMKRNQRSPKICPIELPASNFFGPTETVGESDVRSQKTPEHCNGQRFALSETASEDSCSRKRKSMSLNCDGTRDAVNSAAAFYSSGTSLTKDERMQLRKRLKSELEQVRRLLLRIEAKELELKGLLQPSLLHECHFGVDLPKLENNGSSSKSVCELLPVSGETLPFIEREVGIFHQPSLDVSEMNQGMPAAVGKEKRTPKVNQLYLNAEFVSGKDKMPASEKLKAKPAASLKRSLQGKGDMSDSKRQKVDNGNGKKLVELMRQCGTILKKLMSHKHAWVFNEPVDVVKLGLHDYLQIIEKPMDLGTIKSKLEGDKYASPAGFAEDVRLTFANAMKYNPPGHDVHIMADIIRKLFEERWRSVEVKLRHLNLDEDSVVHESRREILKPLQMAAQNVLPLVSSRRSRAGASAKAHTPIKSKEDNLSKRQMTYEEKQTLSQNLENLPLDKQDQFVQIIRSKKLDLPQVDGEIEVDIDSFDSETLWELHCFVTECQKSKKSVQTVSKQSEGGGVPQLQSVNGVPRISKAGHRGGEGGEEEVDIGFDMPSASFPPVDIDKDVGVGSKYSSSSSSSSDSGSSSSDSDSGSSSGSDSDADDAQSPGAGSKVSPRQEPVGSGAVREQKGSPALKMDGVKRSMSHKEEETSLIRSSAAEPEERHEGEAAVPEQQVSPDKLLRAALLKNRFADTILKAQEKTLPLAKSDWADPEKMRREREVLDRRLREEKARLQAEAKAAELAREKAEAEAAAKARRQREAEREAARLALQQMEKTVEIDENSEILKDLEMLRTKSLDHIPISSSVDETSPVHSPDGLSAFALHGGNPLEQLGLFMKVDEEEDDQDNQLPLQWEDNVDGSSGDNDEEGEIEC